MPQLNPRPHLQDHRCRLLHRSHLIHKTSDNCRHHTSTQASQIPSKRMENFDGDHSLECHYRDLGGGLMENSEGGQCHYCDRWFVRPTNLKRHLSTHTDDKPYGCALCPFRCNRKDNLKGHVARMHENTGIMLNTT